MGDSVVCLHFLFKRDGQNKGTPEVRPPESEQTLLGCPVPSPLPSGMPLHSCCQWLQKSPSWLKSPETAKCLDAFFFAVFVLL